MWAEYLGYQLLIIVTEMNENHGETLLVAFISLLQVGNAWAYWRRVNNYSQDIRGGQHRTALKLYTDEYTQTNFMPLLLVVVHYCRLYYLDEPIEIYPEK